MSVNLRKAATGIEPVAVPREDPADRDVWWYEVGFHDGRLVGRDEAFREVLAAPRVSDEWLPADAMARRLGEMERPR